MTAELKQVQGFWAANPCGLQNVSLEVGSLHLFLEYERYRYTTEPYILNLLIWRMCGESVL